MTFATPADARLAAKAIREHWAMAPADRAAAIEHLRRTVADPKTRPQLNSIATNALATVDQQPTLEISR